MRAERPEGYKIALASEAQESLTEEVPHQDTPVVQPPPQKRTAGKLLQDSGDAQEASTEEVVHQDTPFVQPRPQQRTVAVLCAENCDNCSHCGRL